MIQYTHSPKIICLTGPRAAGKTTVAKQLTEELGYFHIWLDGINGEVCKKLNIDLPQVNLPTSENYNAYADIFKDILKKNRYQNIIFEGERIRFPYILETFLNNVSNYYGEYALIQGFSLAPSKEQHIKQFQLREIQRLKNYIKNNAQLPPDKRKGDSKIRDFDLNIMPDPDGFVAVENSESIMQWARDNQNAVHPAMPKKYANVIKTVADSSTYTPFYQTVEVDGQIIINGMTRSDQSWRNVKMLGVVFEGKSAVDLGAMHGYFSFKIEENGAKNVTGLEINPSSVEVARFIAKSRKSKAIFDVCDVNTDSLPKCDIMLAMNMLHWVNDAEMFVAEKMAPVAKEIVLEIGEIQIKPTLEILCAAKFTVKKIIKSHRPDKLIGQRYLLHLVKNQTFIENELEQSQLQVKDPCC